MYKQLKQNKMNTQILNYINEVTHRLDLETLTTKEVAQHFSISVQDAYRILNKLDEQNLLVKLEPVNGERFDCCHWVRNED